MLQVLLQLMTLLVYRADPAQTIRALISTAARAHTHTQGEQRSGTVLRSITCVSDTARTKAS